MMVLSSLPLKYEEQVIFQLRSLYRKYGYTQYRMSKFEEYELYAKNKSFLVSDQVITFTDTDGRLLALKPDVTLSIIKNSRPNEALQKVYYNENVYRTAPTSHGYREIPQVGLECIGNLDSYAVCEVLTLAARSLETISTDYILDISHTGIVSGFLDSISIKDRNSLLPLIAQKNTSEVRSRCLQWGISADKIQHLCQLIELYGTPEQVLPVLESLVSNQQMAASLEKLRIVCSLLQPYQRNLRLDFSIVNDMSYYNGIIFRGYLPGLASGILAGGQYDNLLQKMGKPGQAIGFAVYLDQLDRYAPYNDEFDVDVLLLYRNNADLKKVIDTAEALRKEGCVVRVACSIPPDLRYRECKEVI